MKKLAKNHKIVSFTLRPHEVLIVLFEKKSISEIVLSSSFESDLELISKKYSQFLTICREDEVLQYKKRCDYSFNFDVDQWFIDLEKYEIFNFSRSQKISLLKSMLSPHQGTERKKKKVLIIDDSKTIQKILTHIISSSSELEVMGHANNPLEAIEIMKNNRPDLITLDIHMPMMNGVEFLRKHGREISAPIILVTSVSLSEGPLVMEALSLGAVSYIEKPSHTNLNDMANDVRNRLEDYAKNVNVQSRSQKTVSTKGSQFQIDAQNNRLIAIGSSTGGTQALSEILMNLPSQIPPILIVQHIPEVFSKALAERLDHNTLFKVKEVEDQEEIRSNTVYIAKGGIHFGVKEKAGKLIAYYDDSEPVNRFRPSVDYLFQTISRLKKVQGVGLILTGMGKDGAKGLLELKEKGFYTITQDQESSVVYGMPKVAYEIGASCEQVSLKDMSHALIKAFNKLSQDDNTRKKAS